ncbi:BrnA antitoxin family protein [Xanthobacter sp. KR7-225]|uniref:BrnA antitoxin family protein n=1 Tax=Xanthobacter sp. KR7-225 TaxID=3156613 RepID=UPI0032B596BF
MRSDIDWARLRAMTDEEIEQAARSDPDWEGLLDLEGWTMEVVVPPKKAPISIRLDADVLAFFKASGRGYQKRINAVLRAFMDAAAARGGKGEA